MKRGGEEIQGESKETVCGGQGVTLSGDLARRKNKEGVDQQAAARK